MQMLKRICRRFRCRSLRDYAVMAVFCTLLMYYISFCFSRSWKESVHHGIWQSNSVVAKALKRSILAQKLSIPEKWSPLNKVTPTYNFSSHLHELLFQLEQKIAKSAEAVVRIVRVRGQDRVLARDLPLYRKVLQEKGFYVYSGRKNQIIPKFNFSLGRFGRRNSLGPKKEFEDKEDIFKTGVIGDKDWSLLLCLTFSDGSCVQKGYIRDIQDYQKMNRFPGLRNVLWKRDAFCSTMTMAKQLPAMRNEQVSPLCFVLPAQQNQLLHVAQALGYSAKWTVKPVNPRLMRDGSDSEMKVFELSTAEGVTQLQSLSNQKMIVQQLQESPLSAYGQAISVRVYVLITSLAPLRAFVYNEGVAHQRYDLRHNFKKISGRSWLLSELWQYVAKNFGQQSVKDALANLYHVLLQMLLIVEAAMLASLSSNSEDDICRHCFQLLGVDLVFNSTFHPVILEVNGQPTLKETSKTDKFDRMKKSLITDVINLLFPKFFKVGEISHDIAQGLLETAADTGISEWSCSISSSLCLSQHDLLYLLRTRLEAMNQGGFKQLYPSSDAGRHDGLVEQLQRNFAETIASSLWLESRRHTTSDLHRLLVNLERWYDRAASEEYYNDMDIHNDLQTPWKIENSTAPSNKKIYYNNAEGQIESIQCNTDPSTMPLLASITVDPRLDLNPPFSPLIMEYYANVSYDVTLIRVFATAQNCQTEARMDDRFGSSRATNTSLGLGENKLSIMVVDIIHAEPWIINSYTITIRRLSLTHGEPPFRPTVSHQICTLKQECDLQMFASEPCDLYNDQRQRDLSWTDHWKYYMSLPLCSSGDSPGRWLIPCGSCTERRSCYWKEAAWHPYDCRHSYLSQPTLQKCFLNKKLLFIGDSTNRGMMHYLIERLNGTLTKWDKTHDIRVYDNVNGGNTTVSFGYYPQFWLPTNQRPVFDKAIYQLIQRTRPLENNSNTILIVGGVHWLATQHLHMLLRAIRVERLHGMKLVMKTLGAGFHQPVESVHTLSPEEQQKLILHSRGLADFAHHYKFEVIDTFNITIARYKDFMQGKCACHFHRVIEKKPNFGKKEQFSNGYHVEGPINAIYSEILMSRLCEDYVDIR